MHHSDRITCMTKQTRAELVYSFFCPITCLVWTLSLQICGSVLRLRGTLNKGALTYAQFTLVQGGRDSNATHPTCLNYSLHIVVE